MGASLLALAKSIYYSLVLPKGYRPEARGYVIYFPRATHEGNKSHNHELKADKRLIFTLAWIPQGMKNTLTKNTAIVHLSFVL